jgi:nucleoside-diphosphate-sugar epimerase
MRLLVTGATGKIGLNFLPRFLDSDAHFEWEIVALCNNRKTESNARIRIVQGSISDVSVVDRAMDGVTHVLHMAAVKESPDMAMDVSVKGMFLLLEAFRKSSTAKQFVLIGGDCCVGHIFHDYVAPITEASPRKAYPGCYALTKVLEEVMLEQYQHQYGVNGCILRPPWIMEKDDFRFALTMGPDQFGGPPWASLLTQSEIARYAEGNFVAVLLDAAGVPMRRGFIHVDDVVSAILAALDNPAAHRQLFNISMNEPVDYRRAARYLEATRGYTGIEIPTPFYSNWLDNAHARKTLGWAPENTLEDLVDRAWNYKREASDPRIIWYPG